MTGNPGHFFMPSANQIQHSIILFDGVCNLCNKSVQFIIKRDKKDAFRFASLQSEIGQSLLNEHDLTGKQLNSFVLVKNNKVYMRSTGALHVAKQLSGAWPLLYALIIIPAFIRNAVYDFIATNRYKWFGKLESCLLPSTHYKNKFL